MCAKLAAFTISLEAIEGKGDVHNDRCLTAGASPGAPTITDPTLMETLKPGLIAPSCHWLLSDYIDSGPICTGLGEHVRLSKSAIPLISANH